MGFLRGAGFGVGFLRGAGFGGVFLRGAGFGVGFLRSAGFGAGLLRGTGFGAGFLRGAGFGAGFLRGASGVFFLRGLGGVFAATTRRFFLTRSFCSGLRVFLAERSGVARRLVRAAEIFFWLSFLGRFLRRTAEATNEPAPFGSRAG